MHFEMQEQIQFNRQIQHEATRSENVFNLKSGNTWIMNEVWYQDDLDFKHEICLRKVNGTEIYYCVELKISPVGYKNGENIYKLFKASSSNITFKSNLFAYENLTDPETDVNSAFLEYNFVLLPIYVLFKAIPPPPPKSSQKKKSEKRRVRTSAYQIAGLKELSKAIKSMQTSGLGCDVTLRCGNREVMAHKSILSVRSTWFSNEFHKDKDHMPKDQQADRLPTNLCDSGPNPDTSISIIDYEIPIFDDFLDFIYTGIHKPCDLQKTKYLFIMARKYGVEDLEEKCFCSLKSFLSKKSEMEEEIIRVDNAIDLLAFSCSFEIKHLEREVIEFIKSEKVYTRLVTEYSTQWEALQERFPQLRDTFAMASDSSHDWTYDLGEDGYDDLGEDGYDDLGEDGYDDLRERADVSHEQWANALAGALTEDRAGALTEDRAGALTEERAGALTEERVDD